MSDDKKVKAHKVTLLVLDLNNPSYLRVDDSMPEVEFNTVMDIETREITWTDEHPLNKPTTMRAAFDELFGAKEARAIAERIVQCSIVDGNTHEYGAEATQLALFVLNRCPQCGGTGVLREATTGGEPFAALFCDCSAGQVRR